MNEATPHLHIDFVPFTTGSKRGLDTRVSLKQALKSQGFVGNGRSETEWAVWVQSRKEQLAKVIEKYDVEWEHLDTHEKHLSVLDYEKKMRSQEVNELESKIEILDKQVTNLVKCEDTFKQIKSLKDYKLLRKILGPEQVDNLLNQARHKNKRIERNL